MKYVKTTATDKIFALRKRIRGVAGGTSASKTISILLWCIQYAQTHDNELISVVSESFPHLRRGCIRDFLNIMEGHGYFKEQNWTKTDFVYTFETGSRLEFFSADQPGKVRGPRRDVLFINEANNISYETYTQLEVRTKKIIWLDHNPVQEYWFYTEVKNKDNVDFLILTYKDNEALDPNIVQAIESRMANKNWWLVYGLGQLGETEGKIYKDWQIISDIPHEARLERYGMDFGYSNDPTAIVAIYRYNGGFILDEITYQKGLSNKQIADILNNQPKALVIADSAEPKSIDEIMSYGVNILASTKGQGSVNAGIAYVQDQRISITKRSVNGIKEYRNYMWKTDTDGKIVNVPDVGFDHMCFTGDTLIDGKKIKDIGIKTGNKKVYEYVVAGETLKATVNHKIITQRGLVNIDALRYNDVIWKTKLLFMRVSGGLDTQTVLNGLRGVTIVAIRRTIEARGRDYTDLYGKKKMDLSQMDSMFIILTAIPSIIRLIILSWLTAVNTLATIGLKKSVIGVKKILNMLSNLLLSGLKQKKGKKEGKKWDTKICTLCWIKKKLLDIAIYVEKNTRQSLMDTIDSATSTVVKKHYVGQEPVYNLKTKSGMYHANRILVSNCDAVRYGISSLVSINEDVEDIPEDNLFDERGMY